MSFISDFNLDDLKNGKYEAVLPEFYLLKDFTENGLWHHQQNVFDHAVLVIERLEEVLKLDFLSEDYAKKVNNYLSAEVGTHSRKELLLAATILHDIAKSDTLIKFPDGTAKCPGHDLVAASQVSNYSQRFGLSAIEEKRVEEIVRYHGLIPEFLNIILVADKIEHYSRLFKQTVGEIALDLVLFMMADIRGSDLEKGDSALYKKHITNLDSLLDIYIKDLA